MLPVILTVAGSDPSGGAGIQADLLTITAAGGYGASAVTVLTVQNSRGVRRIQPVEPELVREQMEAILEDLPVSAVKIGMLGDGAVVRTVAAVLRRYREAAVVLDPVLRASLGGRPMAADGTDALRGELLPLATLLTPNVHESEVLSGLPVRNVADAGTAGQALLDAGARAVLVKGGHLAEEPGTDVLVTRDGIRVLPGRWQDQPNDHGTGCVLSSVIATYLGCGADLDDAVDRGRAFLSRALSHGHRVGKGPGSVDPMFRLRRPVRGPGE